jgi:hypothetical protein
MHALSCTIPYVLHRQHVFTVGLHKEWHNADACQSDFVFRFILLCPLSGTNLCFSHHLVYVQLTERAHLSRVPYTRQPWEQKLEPDDRNTKTQPKVENRLQPKNVIKGNDKFPVNTVAISQSQGQ